MKINYYVNGKKVTSATVCSLVSKDRLDEMNREAVEMFREDPLVENSFYIGHNNMLTIEFDF